MNEKENIRTEPRFRGPSRDGRTNRWLITCPACRKEFEPETTMRRYQHLICQNFKCSAEMVAHYNDEPPFVELVRKEGYE